ncbi:MAG: Ribose-phosphate pyrophosphokinase [Chlamydiae bacterium]|nr:Ribose-phosphate pyrophosphokinase [Chlamydiota bacterium]
MKTVFSIFCFVIYLITAQLDAYLFIGGASEDLALTLSRELGIPIGNSSVKRFTDGEVSIKIHDNVEDRHVFILQSTCGTGKGSINDHFMELFLLARALKRGHAEKITAIIPYYGYARQDRGEHVPISASEVASLIEASGINRVVTIDIHSKQIQGFFHQASLDSLDSCPIFADYLKDKPLHNPVVVAPDAGAISRALSLQANLKKRGVNAEMAIVIKKRAKAGVIESANLLGQIEGCDAIVVDDICDTAGTLVAAGEEIKKMGANKVIACITHPVFSGPAYDRLAASEFSEVVVTNTIPMKEVHTKIKQLSVVPVLKERLINSRALELAKNFDYK